MTPQQIRPYMSMPKRSQSLYVFIDGVLAGVSARSRRGRVYFSYLDSYPLSSSPVSLSLPISRSDQSDISDWMDGLLPDNPITRSRWARELGAASVEPFDLLSTQAGLECAGAVQFSADPMLPEPFLESLVELTDSEMAATLRTISQDAEGTLASGIGDLRMSLPGAQPKMALRLINGGWHLPTGTLPTSHILKPQNGHLNLSLRGSIAVNEHLYQTAAAALGMDAARTWLVQFEDEPCIVTERFDRRTSDGEMRRVHCEDVCQAMGYPPAVRYQADGGPSPEEIIAFLRKATHRDSARRFFISLYFNWLIGNTDGHSKNYGVILEGPVPRLAPLYDISSALPYINADGQVPRTAMRFAGKQPSTLEQWSHTARRLGVGLGEGELEDIVHGLPDALASAARQCPEWALDQADHIAEMVSEHAESTLSEASDDWIYVPPEEVARHVASGPQAASGICGVIVQSTSRPCLLRRGHLGRHRSVL